MYKGVHIKAEEESTAKREDQMVADTEIAHAGHDAKGNAKAKGNEIARNIAKKAFIGTGYKVLLETLKFINSNEKVVEVPYTGFHERVYGKLILKI